MSVLVKDLLASCIFSEVKKESYNIMNLPLVLSIVCFYFNKRIKGFIQKLYTILHSLVLATFHCCSKLLFEGGKIRHFPQA